MALFRRLLFSAIVTILIVLSVLGLYEHSARTTEQNSALIFPEDAPGLKYQLRPGGVENSYGFHERELSSEKPHGMFRVAVLGDSVTHGVMVPSERAYPRIAEQTLQKQGYSQVQVLNFAVFGYDIESIEALARYRMPEWSPDLIVYGFFTNDAIPTQIVSMKKDSQQASKTDAYPLWVGTTNRPFMVISASLDPWFHAHSALFRQLEGAVADRAIATHPDQQSSRWDWYETHYTGLMATCQERHVPLIVTARQSPP